MILNVFITLRLLCIYDDIIFTCLKQVLRQKIVFRTKPLPLLVKNISAFQMHKCTLSSVC